MMKQGKRQANLLRVTALSAALMGVYGGAGAEPANTLKCVNDTCTPAPPVVGENFNNSAVVTSGYGWVVKGENSTFTLTDGTVTAEGSKNRAVGSTAGSHITLDGVGVVTKTLADGQWGNHGVVANGAGSTLDMIGGSISTVGEYSNGMQAEAGGVITGTNVVIEANGLDVGGGTHTYGVEAGNGGKITLEGGSIEVTGDNAAGVRAYTGTGKTAKGQVELDGTSVTVNGVSSVANKFAVGLLAGSKDGVDPATAGNIIFKNSTVSATGTGSQRARAAFVSGGGVLTLENATLTAENETGRAEGVFVEGANSEVIANDLTIYSTASGAAKGLVAEYGGKITVEGGTIKTTGAMNSHAMDSFEAGSVIKAVGVNVESTGYAAGAFDGGKIDLDGGVYDVVGSTPTAGWDSAAGFVVGGDVAGSELIARNVTLKNSAPLLNAPPSETTNALRVGGDFDPDEEAPPISLNATMTLIESDVIASGPKRRIGLIENSSHLVAIDSNLVSEQDAGIVMTDTSSLTLERSTLTANKEGIQAKSGSSLDVRNSTVMSASSHGVVVDGSRAELVDTTIAIGGAGGGAGSLLAGVHASNEAEVTIVDGSINAQGGGQFTRGILALTNAHVDTDGTTIATSGANSHAVHAWGTVGSSSPQVHITGGAVTTSGRESYGLSAQNSGEISTDGTNIATSGVGGFGAFAYNQGKLDIVGGSITTNGLTSFEHPTLDVDVGNYGVLAKNKSTATISGTTVTTRGVNAEALRAENDGAEGDVSGTGSSIIATGVIAITAGTQAHGVTAYGDTSTAIFSGRISTTGEEAVGAYAQTGGKVTLNNTLIQTSGVGAVGVAGALDDDGVVGGTIAGTGVAIVTTGENAHGAVASQGDSKISLTDSSISTNHSSAVGVQLIGKASAELNNVVITSGGAVFNSIIEGSNAQTYNVGAGSDLLGGNGVLLDVARDTAATDNGKVALNLGTGSKAYGNVLDLAGDKGWTSVTSNGQWVGIVVDKTTVFAKDGESKEVAGGDIDNDVASGNGSTLTVTGDANISGTVSAGSNSQNTFQGNTHVAGNVFAQQYATLSFLQSAVIDGTFDGDVGSQVSFQGNSTMGGLTGNGTGVNFSQGGTHVIDGDADLNGGSSIGGGTTANPITITGNANVNGSTLGGNVNVGGIVSGTNGFLNPGNSAGVQTYGSLGAFTGTYIAEVNAAGQSDLIRIASGNADLTGLDLQVRQENGNGGYQLNHDYTIVETAKADGISAVANNKFANDGELDSSFDGTLVKLDPVKYGDNNVKISLSIDSEDIDRTGYSANQNATLDGVLSVAGQNASADAVAFMQADERKDALNQLSGELHGSTQAALLQNSSLVSRTLTQRIRGNLGAGKLPGAQTAQVGGSVAGSMPTSAAYPLWAQVVGNWSTLDSDGNAAKVKTDTAGLFIGGDTEVGAGWRAGGALGYTDGKVKVDDRDSKSDISSFTAALYAGNSWAKGNGKVNFLAGVAYSHHDVDTRRGVNVGGSQTLKADYRANTTQVFTELGYAMSVGRRSVVEPYVGLAWLGQKAKGFTEEGGSAALQGDSQKDSVTTFTLGLRGKTTIDVGASQAHIFAGLGWRHASGDVDPGRSVSFVQGGGTAFNVAGAPIAKNAAILDLGIEMAVGANTAMGLGYSGQYGNDNTDHSGQIFLRTRF